MRCPKCNAEIEEGYLYCKVCGEEIRIVPDYNPMMEEMLSDSLTGIFQEGDGKAEGQEKTGKEAGDKPAQKKGASQAYGKPEAKPGEPDDRERIRKRDVLFVAVGVAVASAVLIYFFMLGLRSNSYSYQYEQAVAMAENADYDRAQKFLDRAQEISGDTMEIWTLRADIAEQTGDMEGLEECLLYILGSLDSENQEAYIRLVNLYIDTGQLDKVKDTLGTCPLESVKAHFADYIPVVPTASLSDGTYYNDMDIYLEADGMDIYFTTDGSKPTTESMKYRGAIHLEKGRTTIRAIAVTETGIVSDEAFFNYQVSYLEAETPVVSPQSGTYPGELEIVVQVPDGCTVLYTLDGTLPDLDSAVYEDPVTIQASAVFTAVSVSMSGTMSDAVQRAYTIIPLG